MTDAIDELFYSPAPEPTSFKGMPTGLLYYCALGEHENCHGYGWVNTEEFKTRTNAGTKLHLRCSCECHEEK